ncbi:MAG: AraC family transcriptional regulator [Bradyrhizobium sp.]|nr:AraC family transcriptional regulator [Bradyrhizobium sp.]
MFSSTHAPGHLRGHFCCPVPLSALSDALEASGVDPEGENFLIETERGSAAGAGSVNGKALRRIAYPKGAIVLANLLRRPATRDDPADEGKAYLPRITFERIADADGATRPSELALSPGAGKQDEVLAGLEDCLQRAMRLPEQIQGPVVDDLVDAIHVHVARLYAGIGREPTHAVGGLAPWQLRRSRAYIEEHLSGRLSVGCVAEICGLSPGHFSRQFAYSAGMPPRRWIMKRRIEVACDKLVSSDMSLADLALSCGFADQSHFTRTFAAITGEAPGRWRREKRASQRPAAPQVQADAFDLLAAA